jgi:ABC-type nitrate/sulfonate/bicarbonate transport system substrate-binding protein
MIVLLTVFSFFSCTKPADRDKVEKVRLGVYADSICALIYIAQEQGFFKRYGLDVSIENYQAGVYAVSDLLADKVDVATATGFVLALRGFTRGDLRAIGSISSADTNEVIARRDRGIGKPGDLKGKRIGVSRGTANDFFLSTFLSFNDIRPGEVRIIDLKPAEMATALSEGKVDAVIIFPPSSDHIKKELAGKLVSWPAQGGQDYYFLMIALEELIKTRPRVVTGLLTGVLEAEAFLKQHEKEAQNLIMRELNLNRETVLNTWSRIHFRVGLDQSLLTLMEDEARWAIQNKLVDTGKIPNYLSLIYLDGLKEIKPEAVSVIH